MHSPLVSIIIPAYNNAVFLGDAIGSVLNQTYPNFELVIVNDASPDNADQVIKSFVDSRIKYIVHEKNRGLSAARNTGICASTGEYIALLDGDDFFHPEKLSHHVEFLGKFPEIDVTYNARFELNHSATTIRDIWRPPLRVDIADLILSYPFAPSDMVVRRQAMLDVNLFDEDLTYYGEDLDINCKLALAGCKFAGINKALNYRRFHSRRRINNLRAYQEDEVRPLLRTFADSRFPEQAAHLKNKALANRFVGWSIFAYLQEDADLGQAYSREAVKLDPQLIEGEPCELLENFLNFSIIDENLDHKILIERILGQLPEELNLLTQQAEWAIARGYLIRGVRASIWGRDQDGQLHFAKAAKYNPRITRNFLRSASAQIISYEMEFGPIAAQRVMNQLCLQLNELGKQADAQWLRGCYYVDTAFRNYESKQYTKVPGAVLHAFIHKPSIALNRGVVKIFLKSLVGRA